MDPFEPGKLMKDTFKFVVLPNVFERISCEEFPFVLDKDGNLKGPLKSGEWTGETLQIPNMVENLKILCERPLTGKEKMPVFDFFHPEVLKQCNTCPNKMSVLFMRTCIADDSRDMSYPDQKALVESRGFGVTDLGGRLLFDVFCILASGTCPDAQKPRWSYARTSDTVRLGNNVYQVAIGGFAPGSGARVHHDFNSVIDNVGVVPGVPAEVPRTLALGALELGKGH